METIKLPVDWKTRTEKEWFAIIVGSAWERKITKDFDAFQKKHKSGKYYKPDNGHTTL
jgi:hypothetical protein